MRPESRDSGIDSGIVQPVNMTVASMRPESRDSGIGVADVRKLQAVLASMRPESRDSGIAEALRGISVCAGFNEAGVT